MKRKFKPGDEIVIVNAWTGSDYKNGDKGIIRETEDTRPDVSWWRVVFSKSWECVSEEEMEHAHVVESPLWRALT